MFSQDFVRVHKHAPNCIYRFAMLPNWIVDRSCIWKAFIASKRHLILFEIRRARINWHPSWVGLVRTLSAIANYDHKKLSPTFVGLSLSRLSSARINGRCIFLGPFWKASNVVRGSDGNSSHIHEPSCPHSSTSVRTNSGGRYSWNSQPKFRGKGLRWNQQRHSPWQPDLPWQPLHRWRRHRIPRHPFWLRHPWSSPSWPRCLVREAGKIFDPGPHPEPTPVRLIARYCDNPSERGFPPFDSERFFHFDIRRVPGRCHGRDQRNLNPDRIGSLQRTKLLIFERS